MKVLSLLFLGLLFVNVNAQDFNVEYKAYMLQTFIKERNIRTLTVKKSTDSLFDNKQIQYKLLFDKNGRLIKIHDYYFCSDTVPERMIAYRYGQESKYYTRKEYHYLDERQRVLMVKKWRLHFDFFNNSLKEEFPNGTKEYRTNHLIFNKAMQLISRSVKAFEVKFRTGFTYDKIGLLRHVKTIRENPTLKAMNLLELNHYIKYNDYRKIMSCEQWIGERDKQVNEYFFRYSGQNILSKVGWHLFNWHKSDKKIKERTDFDYHKNGLLLMADTYTETEESGIHNYTGFEYDFYPEATPIKKSSHRFVMLWFNDIFAENIIQS